MAKIEIEVKRNRSSATQGNADVYVNGEKIISFGDEITLIPEGGLYYGEMIDGWASTKSDIDFIRGAIFWQPWHEHTGQVSEPFLKTLDKMKSAEAQKRPERKTIQMIQNALKENLPFGDERVDTGITEILNTEISGHRIDLGASLEFLSDPGDPDFADGTYYVFNLFVDGDYVNIPGAWPIEEIQKEPDFLVNLIVTAWESAALKLDEPSTGQDQERLIEPCASNGSVARPHR